MWDRKIVELDHKIPLQEANIPVTDRLALERECGMFDPVKSGTVATSIMVLWYHGI